MPSDDHAVSAGLPNRLWLTSSAYALDGGTTTLFAEDETGCEHVITLVQHAWHEQTTDDAVPGRLYYDDRLIAIRSEDEARLVALLDTAEVRRRPVNPGRVEMMPLSPNALVLGEDIRAVLSLGPEDNIRALASDVVAFITSDEYPRFAEQVRAAGQGLGS